MVKADIQKCVNLFEGISDATYALLSSYTVMETIVQHKMTGEYHTQ